MERSTSEGQHSVFKELEEMQLQWDTKFKDEETYSIKGISGKVSRATSQRPFKSSLHFILK